MATKRKPNFLILRDAIDGSRSIAELAHSIVC
jgi:hypothetical protein